MGWKRDLYKDHIEKEYICSFCRFPFKFLVIRKSKEEIGQKAYSTPVICPRCKAGVPTGLR